jgi:hypothetical protein
MNGSLEIECRIDPKFFDNPDNMAEMGSGFPIHQSPADTLTSSPCDSALSTSGTRFQNGTILTCCSPRFNRYMEILSDLKRGKVGQRILNF